jgi:hypothetical protein
MLKHFECFEKYEFFNKEADMFTNLFHMKMKEGLIQSVDYDFFINKLDLLLKKYDLIYEIDKMKEYVSLSIDISNVNRKQFDKNLKSLLSNTGYITSGMIDNDGEKIISFINSKHNIFKILYQKRFDIPKKTPNILYHATTKHYYEKIKKTGIETKHQDMVSYDIDRIYLTDDLAEALDFCTQKRFFLKNKYKNLEFFNMNINSWVILEIDISSIPDIKLYEDPKMSNSYYTYEFIPFYAMRIKQELNF